MNARSALCRFEWRGTVASVSRWRFSASRRCGRAGHSTPCPQSAVGLSRRSQSTSRGFSGVGEP